MRRGTKHDTTKVIFLKTASSLNTSRMVRLAISRTMPLNTTKYRSQALGGHFLDGYCTLPASVPCYFTAPSKASDHLQDTELYLNIHHPHVLTSSWTSPPETRIMTGVSVYIDAILICRGISLMSAICCHSPGDLGNQRLSSSTIEVLEVQAHYCGGYTYPILDGGIFWYIPLTNSCDNQTPVRVHSEWGFRIESLSVCRRWRFQ